MKYLLLILFTSMAFGVEYYIDIKDINLDQWEITIETDTGCVDKFYVDKNVKMTRKLAQDIVKQLKKQRNEAN